MGFPYYAVDLDGTLAHYKDTGDLLEIGLPVPLMLARVITWIKEGKEVRVITARVNAEDNPHADKQRAVIDKWLKKYVGQTLPITCKKSHNMMELWDDRAVQVIPNTGERVLALNGQLLSAEPEDLHCTSHVYFMSGCEDCRARAMFSSYVRNEVLEKSSPRVESKHFEIAPSAPSPKIQIVRSQLNRKLYLFLYNAASDVAVALRKNHVKKSTDADKRKKKEILALAWGAIIWNDLEKQIYSDIYEIVRTAAAEGQAQLTFTSEQELEQVAKEYATTRIADMVGTGTRYSIADTTKDDLLSAVSKGQEEGLSDAELATEIQKSPIFSRDRAEFIADTETVMAQVYGHLEIWKASGKVKSVSIVLSPDHVVEDECDSMVGIYEIEKCPTIPLHPNCKCSIVIEEFK